ncbi:MAG: hypothetical protein EXQ94_11810 [Alphaproteobacteria bacterium]|nr:hypothetical protein [Alphaproteobacteria bacterium]
MNDSYANDPRIAERLGPELMDGTVSSFSPTEGAFYVGIDTATAAAIEVYPVGTELVPGKGQGVPVQFRKGSPADFGPVHVALAVPVSRADIARIGEREGWRTLPCRRGGSFDVIEFWLENRTMLELVPEDEVAKTIAVLRMPKRRS